MRSVFQYRSIALDKKSDKEIKPHALLNLEKNQIYLAKINDVNDPYEGIHNYDISYDCREAFCKFFYQNNYDSKMINDDSFLRCVANIKHKHLITFLENGISCFSKTGDSLLMWGHYADSHKGICIEFNRDESIFKHLIEVTYLDSPYRINIDSEQTLTEDYFLKISNNIVATKHKSWEYEQELRLIGKVGETYKYSNNSIKAIYFGSKVIEETICEVYYSSCHIPHIKYYYMQLDINNYAMKPIDLTDRCHSFAKNNIWIKTNFRSKI